jgi:hypothetical protein
MFKKRLHEQELNSRNLKKRKRIITSKSASYNTPDDPYFYLAIPLTMAGPPAKTLPSPSTSGFGITGVFPSEYPFADIIGTNNTVIGNVPDMFYTQYQENHQSVVANQSTIQFGGATGTAIGFVANGDLSQGVLYRFLKQDILSSVGIDALSRVYYDPNKIDTSTVNNSKATLDADTFDQIMSMYCLKNGESDTMNGSCPYDRTNSYPDCPNLIKYGASPSVFNPTGINGQTACGTWMKDTSNTDNQGNKKIPNSAANDNYLISICSAPDKRLSNMCDCINAPTPKLGFYSDFYNEFVSVADTGVATNNDVCWFPPCSDPMSLRTSIYTNADVSKCQLTSCVNIADYEWDTDFQQMVKEICCTGANSDPANKQTNACNAKPIPPKPNPMPPSPAPFNPIPSEKNLNIELFILYLIVLFFIMFPPIWFTKSVLKIIF